MRNYQQSPINRVITNNSDHPWSIQHLIVSRGSTSQATKEMCTHCAAENQEISSLPGNYPTDWGGNLLIATVVDGLTVPSEILQSLPATAVELRGSSQVKLISGDISPVFEWYFLIPGSPLSIPCAKCPRSIKGSLSNLYRNMAESKVRSRDTDRLVEHGQGNDSANLSQHGQDDHDEEKSENTTCDHWS